ncbi:hypothetical protein HELRODRAFT_178644 [Helobdella robusta]|uniref:Endonuclease/exonuclease/phosphatase domain-containing protein n=1 Tax=Helobdella robusta TaxID=6412 RepID=T1FDH7_HELRO|nr:hypothetical protein HELRODRAFT_178644 [Helobdella robusta]ESN96844.1 hypothetical protein HELRODRAFT_178644 [Helobdella robusta]
MVLLINSVSVPTKLLRPYRSVITLQFIEPADTGLCGKRRRPCFFLRCSHTGSTGEKKDNFYEQLNTAVNATPFEHQLFVLGDFNAQVDVDHDIWRGVLGQNGLGKVNSNEIRLFEFCAVQKLAVTNTVFQLSNKLKTLDAPTIGTLASDRLRHHMTKGPRQRLPHQSYSGDSCVV